MKAIMGFLGTETAARVVAAGDEQLPEAKATDAQVGVLDEAEQLLLASAFACSNRIRLLNEEANNMTVRRKVGFPLSSDAGQRYAAIVVEREKLEEHVESFKSEMWRRLRQRLPACFGQNLAIVRGYRLVIRFDSTPEAEA